MAARDGGAGGENVYKDVFDEVPCAKCDVPEYTVVDGPQKHHCHICDLPGTSWRVQNPRDETSLECIEVSNDDIITHVCVHSFCHRVWNLTCELNIHKGIVDKVVDIGNLSLNDADVFNALKERLASYYGIGLTVEIHRKALGKTVDYDQAFYTKVFWLGDGAGVKSSNKR